MAIMDTNAKFSIEGNSGTYTQVTELISLGDIEEKFDKVEKTKQGDTHKQYGKGLGEYSDFKATFYLDATNYAALSAACGVENKNFKVEFDDNYVFVISGCASLSLKGAKNGEYYNVELTIAVNSITLQSDSE